MTSIRGLTTLEGIETVALLTACAVRAGDRRTPDAVVAAQVATKTTWPYEQALEFVKAERWTITIGAEVVAGELGL